MMDQDHMAALELSRQLNANPRRDAGPPSTPREIRASRRASTSGPPTVQAPESTTLSQRMLSDGTSAELYTSPLDQAMISHGSSAELNTSPLGQAMTSDVTSAALNTSPLDQTSDGSSAELYTSPLTHASPDTASPDTASPDTASSLEDLNHSPTSLSETTYTSCKDANKATIVVADSHFLIQNHVGQNPDSTWTDCPRIVSTNDNPIPETHVRITRVGKRAAHESLVVHQLESGDNGSRSSEEEQPQRRRGRKRKSDDTDFFPQEKESDHDTIEVAERISDNTPSRKRKATLKYCSKPAKKPKLPLYHENVQEGKPEPIGQPEVWAFKRQQLCEALPYYNAYQSGAYTHDNIARAILIDKEVSIRDKFDEEIVITSV
jgi:hypothetical protein